MVALIAVVALLGIGAVTLLSVQSDTQAGGHDRFQQSALYAAESGVAAGIEFLRDNCNPDGDFYTQFITANNSNPQVPTGILGNNAQPGTAQNPFSVGNTWYKVTIYNNENDYDSVNDVDGYATGVDTDGIVILRSEGHGPGETVVTLELQLSSPQCIAAFCEQDYAQKGMNSLNTGFAAVCTSGEVANSSRTIQLGN